VVRRIRASIAEGEQSDKPILTPCGVIGGSKDALRPVATLTPGPDEKVIEANGPGPSSETALEKCGSGGS